MNDMQRREFVHLMGLSGIGIAGLGFVPRRGAPRRPSPMPKAR